MPQSILYRNETSTVLLLDLPASLGNAQNATNVLRSSAPLESPYPSTEPKGVKREAALAAISPCDRSFHDAVQRGISLALIEIREFLNSQVWCYPRSTMLTDSETAQLFVVGRSSSSTPVILSTTEPCTMFSSFRDLEGSLVLNVRSTTAIVTVTNSGDFFIPPRSAFILASLEYGIPALLAGRQGFFSDDLGFDLILMDPPWSNRSVRHSGIYKTQEHHVQDPYMQALNIVKKFIAPQGYVAVWITNKSAVRDRVLQNLQDRGLSLHEEWSWIKVTSHGEPVFTLDGIWRRPYESLLLFQKDTHCQKPKSRVIAAVPDLHSRKLCLKTLFDELLPVDYRALELFARNLTAGWWSWGDEVLKFQHESHWAGGEDSASPT